LPDVAGLTRRSRPWRGIDLGESPDIPTMITTEERRYLRWLTGEYWSGTGDVVEVGPWLGGSTWYLASGMAANPRADQRRRLHVIDNFRWRPFMSERAPLELEADASFRSFFETNVAPWGETITVHETALPDDDSARLAEADDVRAADEDVPAFSAAGLDAPLSIVFIDGAKSWRALRHLLDELAPRFVPGETVLVLQDFQNWLAYWVPMELALLLRAEPGSLTLVHTLQFNTVTFRVEREIPQSVLAEFPRSIDEVSVDEGRALLGDAQRLLEDHGARGAAAIAGLANVAFLGTKGEWPAAAVVFRQAERSWPWGSAGINQLEAARRWLADHASVDIPPSIRARLTRLVLRVRGGLARRARRLLAKHARTGRAET
jgi:hypothetical protein